MPNKAWALDTEHPIAIDSYDHIEPKLYEGEDLSYNLTFNKKLYQICGTPISILDIGCGAGSFVKTVIDDGYDAVGLEGSFHPRDMGMIGWKTVPYNLFTCDVTYPFILHTGDHIPYQFDVVTAWEFVEHIVETDL